MTVVQPLTLDAEESRLSKPWERGMKHFHAGIIIGGLLISVAYPGVAFGSCYSAKTVCYEIHDCFVHGGPIAAKIRAGANDAWPVHGGKQVWSGLNQCTGGSIKGGTGCTNNEYWTIAHAEVVNLDTAVCDKYGN
jgi:hypothetical protein